MTGETFSARKRSCERRWRFAGKLWGRSIRSFVYVEQSWLCAVGGRELAGGRAVYQRSCGERGQTIGTRSSSACWADEQLGPRVGGEGRLCGSGIELPPDPVYLGQSECQQTWPAAQATANLGLLHFDKGEFAQAEQWARRALELRRSWVAIRRRPLPIR